MFIWCYFARGCWASINSQTMSAHFGWKCPPFLLNLLCMHRIYVVSAAWWIIPQYYEGIIDICCSHDSTEHAWNEKEQGSSVKSRMKVEIRNLRAGKIVKVYIKGLRRIVSIRGGRTIWKPCVIKYAIWCWKVAKGQVPWREMMKVKSHWQGPDLGVQHSTSGCSITGDGKPRNNSELAGWWK